MAFILATTMNPVRGVHVSNSDYSILFTRSETAHGVYALDDYETGLYRSFQR
jgi:hypothetical protein